MTHTSGIWAFAVALGAPLAVTACLGTTDVGSCGANAPIRIYTLGDAVSDSLTAQNCRQTYQFTITSQANVRVHISSPSLQTFLQLYDQRGAIVVNSALTQALDTGTTVRMMLGAGTYGLAVNPVNMGQAGAFSLTTSTDSSPVAGCAPIWVTIGITTTQTITTGDCTQGPAGTGYYTHSYAVVLLQSQEVNITEASTDFPPGVLLAGQGNTEVSTIDGAGTTASISSVIITQGAYTIWTGSSSSGQTGKYTLQVQ